MALFGKKKESIKDLDPEVARELEAFMKEQKEQQKKPEIQQEQSQFSSPEDLMKMTGEQVNPSYPQPQFSAHSMQPIQPRQVSQIPQVRMQPQTNAQPAQKQDKATFAPLFVKIDRYRNILKSLGELKTTLALLKNAFVMLDQIEKIENENMNLIASALDNIEKKMMSLDSEFLRPSGFEDETSETYEFQNVQAVVSDLQSQIEQLKNEMQPVQ